MYHVPTSRRRLKDLWATLPRFVLISSVIIACLSAFLMTGRYMWRCKDFLALGNVGLFIVVTIYCFILGILLSSSVNVVAFLLLSPFKRPLPQWGRTLVYSVVALVAIAIIGRVTWYIPEPGEEADALNRFIGRVVTPCMLHVVAILGADYRRNRPHQ